ncbi:MAG: class I SAM-dependent methyltransferase [Rhodospirillales bacterium]
MTKSLEDRVRDAHATAADPAGTRDFYDGWAADYDRDLLTSGTPYMAVCAGMVARHVADRDARILDGGCGTGLIGQFLHWIGYNNIEGLDASAGMLEAARAKGCYRALHEMFLAPGMDLADASFDAVVASGVLIAGHAPPDALDGMVRVAKPGAPIVFNMNPKSLTEAGYGAKIDALSDAGAWTFVEESRVYPPYPFNPGVGHAKPRVLVFRKA